MKKRVLFATEGKDAQTFRAFGGLGHHVKFVEGHRLTVGLSVQVS